MDEERIREQAEVRQELRHINSTLDALTETLKSIRDDIRELAGGLALVTAMARDNQKEVQESKKKLRGLPRSSQKPSSPIWKG